MMTGETFCWTRTREVYASDGDETSEVREGSDRDRRAIVDADQAGQLAICGETKTPRALRTLEPPTDAARMLLHDSRTMQRSVPILPGKSRKGFSAQTSCGEQDSGRSAEVPGRLHVHTYSG